MESNKFIHGSNNTFTLSLTDYSPLKDVKCGGKYLKLSSELLHFLHTR